MRFRKNSHRFRPSLEELEPLVLLSTLTPAQVRHAYGVDQAIYNVNGRTVQGDGSGQTIAIVDAYHDPYAWRDLQTFDRQFGLPDPSFSQYYYGSARNINDRSSQETVLDIEWAHAIAPRANILLIEAASLSGQDIYTAIDWVRRQPGVTTVSMSFGVQESYGVTGLDRYLTTPAGHAGITFVASAGDSRAQANFPAMSPNVVAVGGTTLTVDSNGNYQRETAWSGSGGGYSNYEREPGYQQSVQNTGRRTGPDVAYNADTPVWVAWTRPSTGQQSWVGARGTSAGAPQWAALFATADQIRVAAGRHTLDGPSQTLYALYNSVMTPDFHDITSGSNGYLAHSGYDLVTGRGTPKAQNVIFDLARVNDAFHGAVVASSAVTASSAWAAPMSLSLADADSTEGPGQAEFAFLSGVGAGTAGPAPRTPADDPVITSSSTQATRASRPETLDTAHVLVAGRDNSSRAAEIVFHTAGGQRAENAAADLAALDYVFGDGAWPDAFAW